MKLLERNYKKYNFEEDYEVYLYGQNVFLFNLLTNLFIVFVGVLLNELFATLVWIISFSSLRVNLGGYHCQSPMKCVFTTSTVYLSSIMINKYCNQYFLALLIIFIVLLIIFYQNGHRLNNIATVIMAIEMFCLCIKPIRVIIVLTLIENIFSSLIDTKN